MNSSPARIRATFVAQSLNQGLRSYSLAASAAGVSLMALAYPANAEIVYTPAGATLTRTGQFPIDFNHDGVVDFLVLNQSLYKTGTSCSFCGQNLKLNGNGNVGAAVVGKRVDASALRAGAVVGPADPFLNAQDASVLIASAFNDNNSFFNIYGKFPNTENRFAGLKFEINGEIHYGWIRFLIVKAGFRGSVPYAEAVVKGYAYETIPNQPIIAGQTHDLAENDPASVPLRRSAPTPATLGLLATGSSGLSVWRREEQER
jgi:hypothetical protein